MRLETCIRKLEDEFCGAVRDCNTIAYVVARAAEYGWSFDRIDYSVSDDGIQSIGLNGPHQLAPDPKVEELEDAIKTLTAERDRLAFDKYWVDHHNHALERDNATYRQQIQDLSSNLGESHIKTAAAEAQLVRAREWQQALGSAWIRSARERDEALARVAELEEDVALIYDQYGDLEALLARAETAETRLAESERHRNNLLVDLMSSGNAVDQRRELGKALGITNGAYGWFDLVDRAGSLFLERNAAREETLETERKWRHASEYNGWLLDKVIKLEKRNQTQVESIRSLRSDLKNADNAADAIRSVYEHIQIKRGDTVTVYDAYSVGFPTTEFLVTSYDPSTNTLGLAATKVFA